MQPPWGDGFAIPGCYDSADPPVERPVRLVVTGCNSVGTALQDMSWTSWEAQGADGTGVAVFKICRPDCATGYQLTDQVVAHAWNPQPAPPDSGCPAGLQVFADLILAFPKGVPPPAANQMNTQYDEMPAVHYTNYPLARLTDGEFIGRTLCQ
jgi:hypothetical protein